MAVENRGASGAVARNKAFTYPKIRLGTFKPKKPKYTSGKTARKERLADITFGKSGVRKTRARAKATIAKRAAKDTGNPRTPAPAPVKPVVAAPKPAAVTTPATTPAVSPYVPDVNAYKAAQAAVRAAMADRGMLDSTMYASAMGQAASEDQRRNFLEQEQMRQFNTQAQQKWYEMLTAKVLQEAQIRGEFENLSSQYPNQPSYLSTLYNYSPSYTYPNYGSGPKGDPVGASDQPWKGFKPAGGKTLGGKQLQASIEEAAQRIALQRRAIELEEEKWKVQQEEIKKGQDIWKEMATIAAANLQPYTDKEGKPAWAGLLAPTTVLENLKAQYGVDIAEVAKGNPKDPLTMRARGIYNTLYPGRTAAKAFEYYDKGQTWDDAWKYARGGVAPGEEAAPTAETGRSPAGRFAAGLGFPEAGALTAAVFSAPFQKGGETATDKMNKFWDRELSLLNREREIRGQEPITKSEANPRYFGPAVSFNPMMRDSFTVWKRSRGNK